MTAGGKVSKSVGQSTPPGRRSGRLTKPDHISSAAEKRWAVEHVLNDIYTRFTEILVFGTIIIEKAAGRTTHCSTRP